MLEAKQHLRSLRFWCAALAFSLAGPDAIAQDKAPQEPPAQAPSAPPSAPAPAASAPSAAAPAAPATLPNNPPPTAATPTTNPAPTPASPAAPAAGAPAADATPAPPADPPAQAPVPAAVWLEEQQRQLLANLRGPPEPLWLEVGEHKVLAFWQDDLSGKPLGAVLLLHAEGENPRWNNTLLRLHRYLPRYGWATFSVALPKLPTPPVPDRPVTAPPVTDPATTPPGNAPPAANTTPAANAPPVDETKVVHQDAEAMASSAVTPPPPTLEEALAEIRQRVAAAVAELQKKGQYNLVLLGEGASAIWALEYVKDAVVPEVPRPAGEKKSVVLDRAVRALVLLDPQVPYQLAGKDLAENLSHPQVPTLDIVTDLGFDSREAAAKRRQASITAGYDNYVQRRLAPQDGITPEVEETPLTKAIRGFLQRHARGVELE